MARNDEMPTSPSGQADERSSQRFWVLDRGVWFLARHWLALINLFWGLYVGLPVLAPIFMEVGWTTPARIVYILYRPACHQRPDRSFFIGGPQAYYSEQELMAGGVDVDPLARAIGNSTVGWKVAFCERDVAIYGSIFLAGLAYGPVRGRFRKWRMPLRYYLLFVLPMGVDGVLQLFGVYESNWAVRTATGALFGAGSVFLAYPYLDEGFRDVGRDVGSRLSGSDAA